MNIFNETYSNIISELISIGLQSQSHFPKLSKLGFKVFFTKHAHDHDADRDVTKGNTGWLNNIIDENISKAISSGEYKENIVFSLFTEYYDLTQIPIMVDFTLKKVTILTIISTLSQQRFDRLSTASFFNDSLGRKNIPIRC